MTQRLTQDACQKMSAAVIMESMSSSIEGTADSLSKDAANRWKAAAISRVTPIVDCLVWLRDHKHLTLTPATIRTHMAFENAIKLSHDKDIPTGLRDKLVTQLNEMPGFIYDAFDEKGKQKPDPLYANMEEFAVAKKKFGYLCSLFNFE